MAHSIKSNQDSVCNGHKQLQFSEDYVNQIFDEYCLANTFKAIQKLFDELCQATGISQDKSHLVYNLLKLNIKSWKAQNIWSKLDKKLSGWEYGNGRACSDTKVLVIGCGPCGLRVAIEAALLGCKVVILEKRDGFTRNNVLHLWPFLIHDLKSLGSKHFFGKFCSGSIDHISIRTLQCILLKVALILGVEVHAGVEFLSLLEPQSSSHGWKAHLQPADHKACRFIFDVCISADGKRNTMPDFKRKEFRGKLAIAITANFINHKTKEEASVEEISGVSYIFNQKFFKDLSQETGIDLENIVYYKDETHYFVMTAKKQNLLTKKVLLQDFEDPELLLGTKNVDQQALMLYAIKAAEFSTNHKLLNLEFAHNQYGQPDVSMFDFTSMFAAENACRVIERSNQKLLLGLVGDTLLEPFWPTGSGCARGFLSALDAAWMIKSWSSQNMNVLDVIAERESIYQLLSQTTPENLNKNYSSYSIDPSTRYMNLNLQSIHPQQVRYLFDGTNMGSTKEPAKATDSNKFKQYDMCEKYRLMRWCQAQLDSYESLVRVVDMYTSWKSGIALSALIHRYRPELIDVYSLDNRMALENIRGAINILEEEFGIIAEFDAEDLLTSGVQVENLLTSYLLQFRDVVTNKFDSYGYAKTQTKEAPLDHSENKLTSESSSVTKVGGSKVTSLQSNISTLTDRTVTAIAQNFSMKSCFKPVEGGSQLGSNTCYVCGCRVYLVQRLIAEGFVFHRNCFRCSYCLTCLHKDYYAYCKEESKFFCKHHFGLKRRSPTSNATKMSKSGPHDSSKSKHRPLKRSKISERAEYTTESEIGENEDDQARHNLISLSSPSKSEFDMSTSEEELQFLVDDASDEEPDFGWAHVAKLCSTQLDERIQIDSVRFTRGTLDMFKDQVKSTSIISLDSTSEGETVGGSDADWETDTEMEEEINDNEEKCNKENLCNFVEEIKPEIIRSIQSSAISSNRMAFFSTPAQPVRIDARAFLGLGIQVNVQDGKIQEKQNEEMKLEESPDITQVAPHEPASEFNGSKAKSRPKLKRKPKKFTKKRKKEEKSKKKANVLLREISNEQNSGNHVRRISSSPSSPVATNDETTDSLNRLCPDKGTIGAGMTDLIEKMSNQFLHPPTTIVQLSSESDPNEERLSMEVSLNKKSLVPSELCEDITCIFAQNLVDGALTEAQKALAQESLKLNDNSSTASDPDPATILGPSHIIAHQSSSAASLIEVEDNDADQMESFQLETIGVNNETRRLSQRSTSYDSCLKLSAAIDNLLENICTESNISPAINLNVENDSISQWQDMESSGTTSADVKPLVKDNMEKPASRDSLSMSSVASSKSLVSPNKFIDAKRKFFYEAPQPVRIDHRAFFGELAQKKDVSSNEIASRDMMAKSIPSNGWETLRKDQSNGDEGTKDDKSSNSMTLSTKGEAPDTMNKSGVKDNMRSECSPFDSSEEVKQFSDALSVQTGVQNAERTNNYFSDPETSYKIEHHDICSNSSEIRNKHDKISDGKEKKRSFLSKIIQLKHEKKVKRSNISLITCKHPSDQQAINSKTNSLPLEKKKQSKRKVFEKGLAIKSRSHGGKCEGMGQSVYEEMAPIMEGIKKVQQRNKEKNNIKERVQVIAPPVVKTPIVNLVPPKADIDDFETESELGDERLSLWSLHSQSEKMMYISEEETSRQRKKQLKLVRRKHKEKELSRMHALQEIMGKLEEIEIQQQQVEERGVQIERILRGEKTEQEKLLDEVFLIQEWFNAIQEMNFLNRHESELIVQTRELELEDKQYQLQLQLQETMLQDDNTDKSKEQEILQELVDVVEKRDKLVLLLEEERLKHRQYDHNLQKIMEERGFILGTSENNFS